MIKKLITIVGARPQFIKSSIVSKKLKKNKGIEEIYIHTGQHYDDKMSDIFFEELEIDKPKYNLHIGSGNHGEQTGKMIIEIEKVLLEEKPDGVLLYGDTNSTLAGAIAASKLNIPIFHVEGGIRENNLKEPEEVNRILTDHVSTIIFTPLLSSLKDAKKEGLLNRSINSGDVMLDRILENKSLYSNKNLLKKLNLEEKKYYLLTLHRPVNVDIKERLQRLLTIINSLDKKVVFPIHPRTKNKMENFNIKKEEFDNIIFIEPLGYNDLMTYVKYSSAVMTDSGGLQKEACFLGKKCIVIFDYTPWKEIEELKGIYVWKDLNEIQRLREELMENYFNDKIYDIFGNGEASQKIVDMIDEYLISR